MAENTLQYWDRLSLEDFVTIVQKHVDTVTVECRVLQRTYQCLREQEELWPEEYDHALLAVKRMKEPIHGLSTFLMKTSQLPLATLPLSYQFMGELRYLEAQLLKIITLLTFLQEKNGKNSSLTHKRKLDILRKLEFVLDEGEDIERYTKYIFDRSRFLERKLSQL